MPSLHLTRPPAGGLGKLHKPESGLQGNDKRSNPRLANHGAGNSPSGPPMSFGKRPSSPPASEEREEKWSWYDGVQAIFLCACLSCLPKPLCLCSSCLAQTHLSSEELRRIHVYQASPPRMRTNIVAYYYKCIKLICCYYMTVTMTCNVLNVF